MSMHFNVEHRALYSVVRVDGDPALKRAGANLTVFTSEGEAIEWLSAAP